MRNTMAPFSLGKRGDGAIVASFGPEREHPPLANALVTSFFSHRLFQGEVAMKQHDVASAERQIGAEKRRDCSFAKTRSRCVAPFLAPRGPFWARL